MSVRRSISVTRFSVARKALRAPRPSSQSAIARRIVLLSGAAALPGDEPAIWPSCGASARSAQGERQPRVPDRHACALDWAVSAHRAHRAAERLELVLHLVAALVRRKGERQTRHRAEELPLQARRSRRATQSEERADQIPALRVGDALAQLKDVEVGGKLHCWPCTRVGDCCASRECLECRRARQRRTHAAVVEVEGTRRRHGYGQRRGSK
eukprot:3328912-Prymnesium_polylepis.1